MSNRFSLYPATLYLGGSAINLRQLESHSWNPNTQKSFYTPGGALDRQNAGLQSAKPMHQFSTRDLETIFTNVSPSVGVESDDTVGSDPGAVWRFQQRKCQSGFDSTAVHISMETERGFVVPTSVSCNEGDVDGAIVNLDYHSLSSDGLTDPDSKTGSVDLSAAPTVTFVSQFFMGPTYYNGSAVAGIDGFDLNFGINVDAKLFNGVYPTCAVIMTRQPELTLTGTNYAVDAAVDQYINSSAGAWVQYLRRGAAGNTRVADATTSHIKFTISASEWCIDSASVSGTEDGQVSIKVIPVGATVAVTLSTAIP